MKGTVAPGATFENAHELPNGTIRPGGKQVSNKSGGNGVKKKTPRAWMPAKMEAELKKADLEATMANRRILVIEGDGRRHFVKLAEYQARS
jgi:hypothetical protein